MSKNILKVLIKKNTKDNLNSIIEDFEKKALIPISNDMYITKKNMFLNNPKLKNDLINSITDKTIEYIKKYDIEEKDIQDNLENELYNIIFCYINKIDIDNKN